MTTALIGHTGFVGSNLSQQTCFDDTYHSANIGNIEGKTYDLIISAGVSSLKWKANREPQADRDAIQRLMTSLAKVKTELFVLISTIDVYDKPILVNEDSPVFSDLMMPYGKHRWELEEFIRERFKAVIIRLPNLFGEGLKKNMVYDLLHDHEVDQINQDSVLQWYAVKNLWADIQTAIRYDLRLLNIATEPWPTRELVREVFDVTLPKQNPSPALRYDFQTRYSTLWGKTGPYLYSKSEVSRELIRFVEQERKKSFVQ